MAEAWSEFHKALKLREIACEVAAWNVWGLCSRREIQMNLSDRIALVTGASRGIGREIALGFARAGAHVVLTARDRERLSDVAAEIAANGGASSTHALDVTDHKAIRSAFDRVVKELGRIDILCNNSGVNTARGKVADVSPGRFAEVHAVNLLGLYACCHLVLPHMFRQGYGRVVNVSSGSAFMCDAEASAYSSSKAAVNALTIALSKEVKPDNVLVNAMSPGSVTTDMNPEAETPASAAVPTAIWLASLPGDGPTGRFYRFMKELPIVPDVEVDFRAGP